MCTLIKARHWLFNNAEEPWISEDNKSMIATSLATLVNKAVRCGAINWPVKQGVSSVCLAAMEAARAHHNQDMDMADAMVRLPIASLTRPAKVTSRVKPKGLCPLPVPLWARGAAPSANRGHPPGYNLVTTQSMGGPPPLPRLLLSLADLCPCL